jgi:uncharacterized protein
MPRLLGLLLVVVLVSGCGTTDDIKSEASKRVDQAKEEVRKGVDFVEREARKVGARATAIKEDIEARVDAVLADLEGVVPRADEDTVVPEAVRANSFQGFMGEVFDNVDSYWRRTFTANGIARPRVQRVFIGPGRSVRTACNEDADDQAAFYCPADDTIYVGESIARDILDNLGDFGVAYVIAHEYAHNVQQELGWYANGFRFTTVAPFELQADCMAGSWAFAVYREGLLDAGDVEEAVQTAYAVGDFDFTNPQHHGTPNQRARAWKRGYRSGDPSRCQKFTRA